MLTLERKEGESIIIYNNDLKIEIIVQTAQDGRAKIKIEAPQELKIAREEVFR